MAVPPDLERLITYDEQLRMVPTDRAALAQAVDALRELAGRERPDPPDRRYCAGSGSG